MQISLDNIYKHQAEKLQPGKTIKNGEVKWMAPSNIALIKYWGKRAYQLPLNPSISLTLKQAYTITKIQYSLAESKVDNNLDFKFDGVKKPEFEVKVQRFIHILAPYFPFLQNLKLEINTSNSFPHSTGIASSASGMAALALCFCSIERNLFGTLALDADYYRKASFTARLGSGSAGRSVYGGFVLWGETPLVKKSFDQVAVPIHEVHYEFRNFRDTILIVSTAPKTISSSIGHDLMKQHPYAKSRNKQALVNLSGMLNTLKSGDIDRFIQITENEALSLHALMMTSNENYILLLPNTLEIIKRIQLFREMHKVPVCFTLDAGANVHMLYPERYAGKVDAFINDEIVQYCEKGRYITDREGKGPEMLSN